MKWVPRYYKTTPLSSILRLESVQDRKGNLFYCVTIAQGVHDGMHFFFSHLSSAIDFINCNFNNEL